MSADGGDLRPPKAEAKDNAPPVAAQRPAAEPAAAPAPAAPRRNVRRIALMASVPVLLLAIGGWW